MGLSFEVVRYNPALIIRQVLYSSTNLIIRQVVYSSTGLILREIFELPLNRFQNNEVCDRLQIQALQPSGQIGSGQTGSRQWLISEMQILFLVTAHQIS